MKGTHRWVIPNWSKAIYAPKGTRLTSEKFVVGGVTWRILVYPHGDRDPYEQVGVYLCVTDADKLPDSWEKAVTFRFTVHGASKSDDESKATINARSVRSSYLTHTFKESAKGFGPSNLVSVADVKDWKKGLVSRNDEVVITVRVSVPTVSVEMTCVQAAQRGTVDMLKFARKNDATWDETCAAAAAGGHLEALKWAHENGCPWDEAICKNAAEGGHIEALKYARANGCPWNSWTNSWAVGEGHREVQRLYNEELERRHQAIPGLNNEVVVKHVLDLSNVFNQAELARLRVVSPVMRDAVTATGFRLKKPAATKRKR
jgi:hypothetical protein